MYYSVKSTNFCHHMDSFKLKMHRKSFSASALPWTPLGEVKMLPGPFSWLGRGHLLPIPLPRHLWHLNHPHS